MQSVSGRVSCIASDPAMDWLFIGLESGVINVYDVDRGVNSPFSIGNVQNLSFPKLLFLQFFQHKFIQETLQDYCCVTKSVLSYSI